MEEKHFLTISFDNFLNKIQDGLSSNSNFCFILGSGASASSKIETGKELAQKWRSELMSMSEETHLQRMREAGIDESKYTDFFCENYEVQSEDYFDFYAMRFAGDPASGYKAIQDLMKNAEASIGYYALATILNYTKIKFVITTNFDSLTEDTILLSSHEHPLIVGHESLASYLTADENSERIAIAKVHRDQYFAPKNSADALAKLEDNWKEPLESIFKTYKPIVIGYAGGDKTLMTLLESVELKGIYWCSRRGESGISSRVEELLNKESPNPRYLVDTKKLSFDDIMLSLCAKLGLSEKFEDVPKKMVDVAKKKAEKLNSDYQAFRDFNKNGKERTGETGDESPTSSVAADSVVVSDGFNGDLTKFDDAMLRMTELLAFRRTDYEESLKICNELIRRNQTDAKHYNSRSVTLHIMGRYEEALADSDKAIELAPHNAEYYDGRGSTLHEMGRYEEALADSDKAIELAPDNSEFYNSRSVTLHKMGRYEEALADSDKAIELAPHNAEFYRSRSITLREMDRCIEALEDCNTAISMVPDKPLYYETRSTVLRKLGREDEAVADEKKAEELLKKNEPNG